MKYSMVWGLALFIFSATTSAGPVPQDVPAPDTNVVEVFTESFTGTFNNNNTLISMDEPVNAEDTKSLSQRDDLEKRIVPLVAVGAIIGTAALTKVTELAINAAVSGTKDISNWNRAREEFTQRTVTDMWARNPDRARYPAAACYNKGYGLKRPAGIAGGRKAKFSLGMLHTDYDCMYVERNNAFYTHSKGGFINLAYMHSNACTYDRATGDLSCR